MLLLLFAVGCRREPSFGDSHRPDDGGTGVASKDVAKVPAENTATDQGVVVARPYSKSTVAPAEKMFTRLGPAETGINFTIEWDKPAKYDRIFYSQNTGGGVTIGDFDGDDLPEIIPESRTKRHSCHPLAMRREVRPSGLDG